MNVAKMRRAALAPALVAVLASGACVSKKEHQQLQAEKTQVVEEKQKVSEQLQTAAAENTEMNATLDEVQASLEDLRGKELKVIQKSLDVAQEGQVRAGRRERLQSELRTIRQTIHQNLEKLARLQKENKRLGVVAKLADELKRSLQEKESTIATLQSRIGDLSQTVEQQTATIALREGELQEKATFIEQQTTELHKAYVAVAAKDVLKQKGVVQRKGDVLGVGGTWSETGRYDPELFREVDVTKEAELEIPAPVKKVRVLPGHPADSYEIASAGPDKSTLKIKDPDAFWRGDKYLVVMLPD